MILIETLLKSPATLVERLRERCNLHARLAMIAAGGSMVAGLVAAAFSGGAQVWLLPLKSGVGLIACALVCLPSLHIFSCLAGAQQTLRETAGALLMGLALSSMLLVGFGPVAWVFSQATSSVAFMGGLHLAFLTISIVFGLGLVNRTLAALNGRPLPGLHGWSVLFVVVLFQMTTSLRPLVGAAHGAALEGRQFFLAHWFETVAR